jgi:hypothetical protein
MAPSLASPVPPSELRPSIHEAKGCTPTSGTSIPANPAAGQHGRTSDNSRHFSSAINHNSSSSTQTHDSFTQTNSTDEQQNVHDENFENFGDPAKTWNPDPRVYYSRRLQHQRAESTRKSVPLPPGFPVQIDPASPLVWSGQDLVEQEYLRHLEEHDIAEIESALEYFKSESFLLLD